jgi:hypothetical protein
MRRFWISKISVVFLLEIVFLSCAWAQASITTSQSSNPTQDTSDWTEPYRDSTISIGRIVTNANRHIFFQPIGAGIIVGIDEHTAYIVTAKHVFDDPSQNWHPSELRIRFAWQEKESEEQQLGVPIKLTDEKGTNLWTALDDSSDIAGIPIPADFSEFHIHAISFGTFASAEDLFDGATVFIYGFPGIVGNERLVRAVTRSGIVAWTDPSDPLGKPFMVDANIFPGNSGGPVFKMPVGLGKKGGLVLSARVAFLGIISQDFTNFYAVTADGRIVTYKFPDSPLPSVAQVGVTGIGGLGIVEPAEGVRKLIQQMYNSTHPPTPLAPH